MVRVLSRFILCVALSAIGSIAWAQTPDPPVALTAASTDCATASSCAVLTAPANGVVIALAPVGGTFQAEFEMTANGGRTWEALDMFPLNTTTGAENASAAGTWRGAAGGLVRVRLSTCDACSVLVVMTPLDVPPTSSGGPAGGGSFDGVLLDEAEGDPVTDTANDALRVNVVAGGGSGGTALADDDDFADGTTEGTPIGGVAEAASPTTVTEGDFGWAAITLNRALKTSLFNASGTAAFGTAGSAATPTLTVQGIASMTPVIVTATDLDIQSGGADVLSTTAFNAAFGTAGSSDTQVLSVQGIASGTALPVTATNLDVQIGGSDTVTVTATNLDVQIGGSDTVAVSNSALTELAAAINSNLVDVNIVSGAGSGGTALADDADFTAGTTSGTPAIGFYQSSVTACTDGDACVVGLTAQRTMKVTLFSAAGSELTPSADLTVGSAFGTTGPGLLTSYKEFDGSALPTTANVGTEEEANPLATTLQGVLYGFLTNENGSKELGKLEDDAHASADYGVPIWSRRINAAATSAGSDADYATVNTDALGLLWTRFLDPCSGVDKTHIPINISTATTTELTAALAGASTNYYVCSLNLVTAGANNVALVDDDSDNCASVTSGLAGGTTAGSGWNFAANGGLSFGNGLGTVFKTNGTNRVLCLVTSAAVQLSGSITVVAAP